MEVWNSFMAAHSFVKYGCKLLYYIPPAFSTVFLYRQGGEGQKGQPHGPGGRRGEGERLLEVQLGDGLGLLG